MKLHLMEKVSWIKLPKSFSDAFDTDASLTTELVFSFIKQASEICFFTLSYYTVWYFIYLNNSKNTL